MCCGISLHQNSTNDMVMAYYSDVIYDSGNEITTLFRLDLWDFENECFFNNNLLLQLWNSNIKNIRPILVNGANSTQSSVNLIIFKNPVYISINGLKPVPIFQLLVPVKTPTDDNISMFLLGMDVISQYTSIISKFNGIVQLRIVEQREEI